MKKSDITPEVIRLAKEIAEVWRMEIYEGCWIEDDGGELVLVRDLMDMTSYYTRSGITPIPSIVDVLGKLRELKPKSPIRMKICIQVLEYLLNKCTFQELYEFCLSALLSVLKEGE